MDKQIIDNSVRILRNLFRLFLFFLIINTVFIYKNSLVAEEFVIELDGAEIYSEPINPKRTNRERIFIKGQIVKGDFEKFKNTLKAVIDSKKVVWNVALTSRGGDVIEAMKIGRWIRKTLIKTEAPMRYLEGVNCPGSELMEEHPGDICVCKSACFIIWAGGVERQGNTLWVHRPYFDKVYFKGLSAEEAQKKYATMSDEVRRYLKDMDIPTKVIELMFEYSSNEQRYIGAPVWIDSMEKVPFYEEWIIANCGGDYTEEEQMDFSRLLEKKYLKKLPLSKAENFYLEHLNDKRLKHGKCEEDLLMKFQSEAVN